MNTAEEKEKWRGVCVWGGGRLVPPSQDTPSRKGSIKQNPAVCFQVDFYFYSSLIYPLTARVIGAPHMILQTVSSIFSCSPLPSRTSQTPGLCIPWCCLPTSSCVCLVFFPLSRCLARWFWPDLMNGRHDHTSAVWISLRWSGGLHVVQLLAGSWHRLPCW